MRPLYCSSHDTGDHVSLTDDEEWLDLVELLRDEAQEWVKFVDRQGEAICELIKGATPYTEVEQFDKYDFRVRVGGGRQFWISRAQKWAIMRKIQDQQAVS